MQEYWHVILESVIDTAKMLPLLFVIYYLIEIFEYKYANKLHKNRIFKGKAAPLFGSLVGCIPQCGISVVLSDLFSKGAVSVGALVAVYVATSDEAIPLMFANPIKWPWMVALLLVKIGLGILMGYLALGLHKVIFKRTKMPNVSAVEHEDHHHEEHHHGDHHHNEDEMGNHDENHEDENQHALTHAGCCHHDVESKTFNWVHPLIHSLKIGGLILIVNILLSFATHIWIGEDALINFMNQAWYLQPLLAVLIGLIPNCASSAALTELFLMGTGFSFGALVAGLCVNAGLGLVILLKQNKKPKENLFILSVLIIPSLIIGYVLTFFGI